MSYIFMSYVFIYHNNNVRRHNVCVRNFIFTITSYTVFSTFFTNFIHFKTTAVSVVTQRIKTGIIKPLLPSVYVLSSTLSSSNMFCIFFSTWDIFHVNMGYLLPLSTCSVLNSSTYLLGHFGFYYPYGSLSVLATRLGKCSSNFDFCILNTFNPFLI